MDPWLTWLILLVVGGGVAWFATRLARRLAGSEEEPVEPLFEEPVHVKVKYRISDIDQKLHSTAYHHRMGPGLVHTWPVERCPCNNGARLDGIVLASEELTSLSEPPPGFIET